MKTVEELIKALKDECKKDMPFERYRLMNEAARELERLAVENRTLRHTVDKLGERLKQMKDGEGETSETT